MVPISIFVPGGISVKGLCCTLIVLTVVDPVITPPIPRLPVISDPLEADVIYLNCSPATKEPLSKLTSRVPSIYALAPVVWSKVTSRTPALAPVLTPTTVKPLLSCDKPVFCENVTRNLSGPKIWWPISKTVPASPLASISTWTCCLSSKTIAKSQVETASPLESILSL